MKPLLVLPLCALALFLVLPVLSASGGEGGHGLRQRLDLDKDGKLDHGELKAAIEETLGKLDADKDGKIDHGEGRAALQNLRERLDTDKDGKIEPGELRAALLNLKEKHPLFYERVLRRIREGRERREEWREKGEKG